MSGDGRAEGGGPAPAAVSLPPSGGAMRGIGEGFSVHPMTGSGAFSVPLAVSPGRAGFSPRLELDYDSGAGNGPFGFGWKLSLPSVTRKTLGGLPQYGADDVFLLSGVQDLVPVIAQDGEGVWSAVTQDRDGYRIQRYRPRVEGTFARIERWSNLATGDVHWRTIGRDNVLTVFGADAGSRIADPDHPERVFSWLISESYDSVGNAIVYDYFPEDASNVDASRASEASRSRTGSRYLERVRYGNLQPLLVDATVPSFRRPHAPRPDFDASQWLFELVLDYGQGLYQAAAPDGDGRVFVTATIAAPPGSTWPVRADSFSSYRSGFEVRTHRLCRRTLMFHHFAAELGTADCLVRATQFTYDEEATGSFLTRVTECGYRRFPDGRFLEKSFPALTLGYTRSPLADPAYDGSSATIDTTNLEGLPDGVDERVWQWTDLDGEGISGALSLQPEAWYYKRNLGGGQFAPLEAVAARPSYRPLAAGSNLQLLDLAGDGTMDLVDVRPGAPGFFARGGASGWESFQPFPSWPTLSWDDDNLRLVDLTGDGLADILLASDGAFTWHPSCGTDGFGPAGRVDVDQDEDLAPRVVFSDGTQTILLADLTGDGLADIVRVRNGEVSYWPNLGYGRFGARVAMDDAPWFDTPELFDATRLRLADTDGNGTTDLVYLGREAIRIYLNQAGNGWSEARVLTSLPLVDNLRAVAVVDLLGRGTSCLCWSSPLPGDATAPLRYVDLMEGVKPNLLVKIDNGRGGQTAITYSSSTEFHLADQAAGAPWATRLPFPVQVVSRVETYDTIGRNRFVNRYSYHHGFFDGVDREFRGFGRVDRLDTEEMGALTPTGAFPGGDNFDASSHVPPMLVKSWFHPGDFLSWPTVSRQFAGEYWEEGDLSDGSPGLTDAQRAAMQLPDSVILDPLSPEECRTAVRALSGMLLRREAYALDGSDAADRPYVVEERAYAIRRLQEMAINPDASFLVQPRETLRLGYERALYPVSGVPHADPRVTHTLALVNDDYGNVQKSASIAYGRRFPDSDPQVTDEDRAEQARTHVTCTVGTATAPLSLDDALRSPSICAQQVYELYNVAPSGHVPDVTNLFTFDEIGTLSGQAADGSHDLDYGDNAGSGATGGVPWRRLIDHTRTIYRRNDLTGPLPLGTIESLALPLARQKLALPDARAQALFVAPGKVTGADLATALRDAGYAHSEGDGDWWLPSRQVFYSPTDGDTAAAELAFALPHFFLGHRYRDPFGKVSYVTYDPYVLLPQQTADPLGNIVTAGARAIDGSLAQQGNDYRVLQPVLVTDPNRNRAAVAMNALGQVVATAVMGKSEAPLGDTVDGVDPDPPDALVQLHLTDPLTDPGTLLGNATQRLLIDNLAFARTATLPVVRYELARDTHVADLAEGQATGVTHHFTYFDGLGREIQQKTQAPPDPTLDGGPPRWIASGWTILDNKGSAVRRYEPFFDASPAFVYGVLVGVSPIAFHDPLGRVVGVLHPNHTWEKVRWDPWRRELWDVNDTVLVADPTTDVDLGAYLARRPASDFQPTWYGARAGGALGSAEAECAAATAIHAATPSVVLLDALGRCFLTREQNAIDYGGGPTTVEYYRTRIEYDIEGNQLATIDALGRTIFRSDYDLLGSRLHIATMDAGERYMIVDVAGQATRTWDSRGHAFSVTFDDGRRPVARTVRGSDATLSDPRTLDRDVLYETLVYGEGQVGDTTNNLRTRLFQRSDGAGQQTVVQYDVNGNAVEVSQALTTDYKSLANWSLPVGLDPAHAESSRFDALNRLVGLTTPDGSVARLGYDVASRLATIVVNVRSAATATPFVTGIDYDAKGQRNRIGYGNGAGTAYRYDPLTLRLLQLTTTRPGGASSSLGLPLADAATVQALTLTYDPVGNVTRIADAALTPVLYDNAQVSPIFPFRYDARYRLIAAQGREQVSQAAMFAPVDGDYRDYPFAGAAALGDPQAERSYSEQYTYDGAGNLTRIAHRASGGAWTRDYTYGEPSALEPSRMSNRLSRTSVGVAEACQYDPHGAITRMPHLPVMQWSFKEELSAASRQVSSSPQMTYFSYDSDGRRLRKVTERENGSRVSDRVYLPGWELYREYAGDGTTVTLNRECLHVHEGPRRVAIVETDTDTDGDPLATAVRYQVGNQVGSTCLELDDQAALISYEEYSPFGSPVFQAGAASNLSRKRYRYTARERDQETGFGMHGVRYYLPWLGRWASTDPAGFVPSDNPTYAVCCKQLGEESRKNPFSFAAPRFEACDPINWVPPEPGDDRKRRPPIESSPRWNLYVYADDNPMVLSDVGGREAARQVAGPGDVNLPKGEIGWLLGAIAIAVVGTVVLALILYFKHGNVGEWLAALYGGLAVLTAIAMIIAGIQSKKKLVDQGYITAAQEARVFDLWAFFHYLVPALIGTGVAALTMALNPGLSGSAVMVISVASTMSAAILWEVFERPVIGAGFGEYPSNIVGDVVIGTIGGAVSSAAFIVVMGKKIPPGVIFLVGASFASAGLLITSGLIWYGGIKPHTGIDTWPDHRTPLRIAPDPIFQNIA